MNPIYTHVVCNFGNQVMVTHIDLSKVVAIKQAGNGETCHHVYLTSLRIPLEILDLPTKKPESAKEFEEGRQENFKALITAWEHVRGAV